MPSSCAFEINRATESSFLSCSLISGVASKRNFLFAVGSIKPSETTFFSASFTLQQSF
jgi:hypothetical protein